VQFCGARVRGGGAGPGVRRPAGGCPPSDAGTAARARASAAHHVGHHLHAAGPETAAFRGGVVSVLFVDRIVSGRPDDVGTCDVRSGACDWQKGRCQSLGVERRPKGYGRGWGLVGRRSGVKRRG
jgi:hypothetical protein